MISMQGKITDKKNKILVCTKNQLDEYLTETEASPIFKRIDIDFDELNDKYSDVYHWSTGYGYAKDSIWNVLNIVKALGYTNNECTCYIPSEIYPMHIHVTDDLCFAISPDICITDCYPSLTASRQGEQMCNNSEEVQESSV